jgi:hypothetical protein
MTSGRRSVRVAPDTGKRTRWSAAARRLPAPISAPVGSPCHPLRSHAETRHAARNSRPASKGLDWEIEGILSLGVECAGGCGSVRTSSEASGPGMTPFSWEPAHGTASRGARRVERLLHRHRFSLPAGERRETDIKPVAASWAATRPSTAPAIAPVLAESPFGLPHAQGDACNPVEVEAAQAGGTDVSECPGA